MAVQIETFAVGDVVELVEPVGHVKVSVGSRGVVLVDRLPFHAVSVSFDRTPDPEDRKPIKYYMIRGVHLRRLAGTPSSAAPPASASPPPWDGPGAVEAGAVAGAGGDDDPPVGRPWPSKIAARAVADTPAAVAAQPAGVAPAPAGAGAGGW